MGRKKQIERLVQEYSMALDPEGYGMRAGLTTEEVAKAVGALRNNASRDLNALCKEGVLLKQKGKPVRFLHRETMLMKLGTDKISALRARTIENTKEREWYVHAKSLDSVLGSKNSLKKQVEMAKAAVMYPPQGLNTILIGPTGVGKTVFAEKMYDFALETGIIDPEGEFVAFNCADYASNQQLLLSQLFGYVKGAFTGADHDKPGVIDRADGGVLLLDEVHRLPHEGQEMLFYLLDKGVYRRLGESNMNRKAKVFMIAATTEKPEDYLLQTFLRRLPVEISIPPISQRTMGERLDIVRGFFQDESRKTGLPIQISKEVLQAFLAYPCPGNIGQLKGDIQLCCAKGYLDHRRRRTKNIQILMEDLPDNMIASLVSQDRGELEKAKGIFDTTLLVEPSQEISHLLSKYEQSLAKVYGRLDQYFKNRQFSSGISDTDEDAAEKIREVFLDFFSQLNYEGYSESDLQNIFATDLLQAVELSLGLAKEKFDLTNASEILFVLGVHLSFLRHANLRDEKLYPYLESIIFSVEELEKARFIISVLNQNLPEHVEEENIKLLAMMLKYVHKEKGTEDKSSVGLVLLAQGEHVADETLDQAAKHIGVHMGVAFCASEYANEKELLLELENAVRKANQGRGVLLLVDQAEFVIFAQIMTARTGILVKAVTGMGTGMVVEAMRRLLMIHQTLDQTVKELETMSWPLNEDIVYGVSGKERVLLIEAAGGLREGRKLCRWFNTLDILRASDVKAVAVRRIDTSMDLGFSPELILGVVSSRELKLKVPIISFEDIVYGSGLSKLQRLLDGEEAGTEMVGSLLFRDEVALVTLRRFLSFADPSKVFELLKYIADTVTRAFGIQLSEGTYLRFIIHCGCMIERLFKGNELPCNEVDEIIGRNQKLYEELKRAMVTVEDNYGLEVPDNELAYILELLETDIVAG
ncbi:sigma 54-interacting transcriptional regulator [Clostridia bacterium]|nr:sigma 54-interacting transcriptional regulator [Clostridia bacterium]